VTSQTIPSTERTPCGPTINMNTTTSTSTRDNTTKQLQAAQWYARHIGWAVFPVRPDKAPYGDVCPNGFKNATTDPQTITRYWERHPDALIALRPPERVAILDVDTLAGHGVDGEAQFARLQDELGKLPDTGPLASTATGGQHWFLTLPEGVTVNDLDSKIVEGLDIKANDGYVILPPGPGREWIRKPSASLPQWPDVWLAQMLKPTPARAKRSAAENNSIADWYTNNATWPDILEKHDWTCVKGDGNEDGSLWRHPHATAPHSASIKHGQLFVYSPNTDFPVRQGQTRFRAYAVLNHGGDLSAAGRELRRTRDGSKLLRTDLRAAGLGLGSGSETDSNAPPQYGDPKQYFERDGLQVRDLADDVMSTITAGYGASDGRLYVYEDGLWIPDDGRIQAEIAARLGNRYRKMHSSNVLDMIKFTPGILRITCDPVPDYINVRNGMVDWRKEKLLPHDPKYCSTVQLPVTYDPNANCPEFDQFLADVLPADCIAFMWELIAYTIYSGNPFHIAVMLYGKGRNGKGTLMRVLKALLGARNTSSVTLYELMDNRFRSATLYGKLANLAGDLDGRWLDNTAIFKALTGGDTIQGEIKHGAIFDFAPWALPFYSMNKPFSSADSSEGWWARWIVVPFPNSFVGMENRTLDNVLQTDAELSGILAHALRVLPALMKRGRLSEPESVRQAKKGFIASSDTLRHFVSENCELDPNAWTERGNLYRAYSRHATENGAKQMSNREFYNRIEQIGGVSEKRKTDGRGFQGIKLIGQPLGGEPLVP